MSGQALARLRDAKGRVMPLTHEEVIDRFNVRVDRSGGDDACWPYTGRLSHGYGVFISEGRTVMAHRFAYELAYGPLAKELRVLHECDNPPCCNPCHLRSGTQKENAEEMVSRERHKRGSLRPEAKLTEDDVLHIRAMLDGGMSQRSVAREFGMSQTTIGEIARRTIWGHV